MLLSLFSCFLWLSMSGLWTIQATDSNAVPRSIHKGLAPTNVDFAFSFYQHLAAIDTDKNIFISPLGISMALAMLSLGASGHTRTQLLQGLGFNLTETPEAEIHQSFQHLHNLLKESDTSLDMTMGSVMLLNHSQGLQVSFWKDIMHYYGPNVLPGYVLDIIVPIKQTKWYFRNKKRKIEYVPSILDGPAMLTLVNYIFFKGTWAHHFNPAKTVKKDFYVNETATVKVPMMFHSGIIKYFKDPVLSCQVVQLDYLGNRTTFFILPDKGKMDTVTAALSRDTIQRWTISLKRRQMNLYIPKISLSGSYNLEAVLTAMGMKELFTSQADLSSLTRDGKAKLEKVTHEAVLVLDEKRVKKDVPVVPLERKSKKRTTIFNRPYHILIFDDFTWSSLFLARVVNPDTSESTSEPDTS